MSASTPPPRRSREERRFAFEYRATVPERACEGGAVEVWIPLPRSDEAQTVASLELRCPLPLAKGADPDWGNELLHLTVPAGSPEVTVAARFEVLRRRLDGPTAPSPADERLMRRYLGPDTKVATSGAMAERARAIVSPDAPPEVKARALFDHLLGSMEYDPGGCTPERAGQLGDLPSACDLRKGTCTEFHGLYVAFSRALGMPARFCFGFGLPADREEGRIAGYHCWAEVLLPNGWHSVDITEALKERGRGHGPAEVDFYFGGADCHRVRFTRGRDLWLAPRQRGGPVDKLIFPHAERGDEAVELELAFAFAPAAP